MKIPNKKNKIVIEYNNNKLIFTNTLYNKTIEIKDINSMYILMIQFIYCIKIINFIKNLSEKLNQVTKKSLRNL